LLALGHPVLNLDPVVADLLALGHPVLNLGSVIAHLLAVDHASLTLDAIGSNLLALGHAVLDPFRVGRALRHPLYSSRALSFGAERLPLDASGTRLTLHCGPRRALHIERLALHGTALGRLRTLAGLGRRSPLTFNLVVGVAATRASRCRRRNRQRGDARGEE